MKYLEDALKNIDRRIDYSTIDFTMIEERSGYANIDFVDFSRLIETIVDSTSSLLSFLFAIAPWAVAGAIGLIVWKRFKRK